MDSFLKADIFFVVTTVAVFAVAVIAIWALVYLVRILRNVEDISETVKKETEKFSNDLGGLRDHVRNNGIVPRFLMRWMGRSGHEKRSRARTPPKK